LNINQNFTLFALILISIVFFSRENNSQNENNIFAFKDNFINPLGNHDIDIISDYTYCATFKTCKLNTQSKFDS